MTIHASDQKNKLSVARVIPVTIISLGTSAEEEVTEAFTPRFLRPCTNNYDLPVGDKKLSCNYSFSCLLSMIKTSLA